VLDGDGTAAVEVEVAGPPAAELQVTALPVGRDRARMTVSAEASWGPEGELSLRARVAEYDGVPVQLTALSWEPLVPGPGPRVDGRRPGRLDRPGVAAAFGTSALPAQGKLRSHPIPLPGLSAHDGPIVIKVVGTDDRGHRVTAWAEVDAFDLGPSGDPRGWRSHRSPSS
jgi:hypothetical protein